jgi:hypothetical protein
MGCFHSMERVCDRRNTTDLLPGGYCPQEECSITADRSQEFAGGRKSNGSGIRGLPLYLANLLGGGRVPKADAPSGISGGQDLAIGRKSYPQRPTLIGKAIRLLFRDQVPERDDVIPKWPSRIAVGWTARLMPSGFFRGLWLGGSPALAIPRRPLRFVKATRSPRGEKAPTRTKPGSPLSNR